MQSISVNGYTDRIWLVPVAILGVLPAVLMGIARDKYEPGTGWGAFLVCMIPAVVAAGIYEGATPAIPQAMAPFPGGELNNLRKYARFPQGMPPGGIPRMLEENNQRELRTIP